MVDGSSRSGSPRVMTARRDQLELRSFDLDTLISEDHRARLFWAAVERLDLSRFYATIAARGSDPGRPAFDPKVLLALWMYATSEGIGSARHLARLCERDHAYQWLCGGLRPNHHALSDFRVAHPEAMDQLLTQVLASLMTTGMVKLERVAQDGVRVRANAGAASFRRGSTLRERCVAEAAEQVRKLRSELESEPGASSARVKAARERAARERQDAVDKALAELPVVQACHDRNAGKRSRSKRARTENAVAASEARVSTTDPDARVMKMGDGGFRPAFNVQFATATDGRVIVGVDVTNEGSDSGQMVPMLKQIVSRTGQRPSEYLVDGGYAKLEAIHMVELAGTKVYAPVLTSRDKTIDAHARKPTDTDRTAEWRARMGTEPARAIYRERAATAETVHADLRRWRGFQQFAVRSLTKVKAVALLMALTHNLIRTESLGRAAKAA